MKLFDGELKVLRYWGFLSNVYTKSYVMESEYMP
jgi:hypothetical protein